MRSPRIRHLSATLTLFVLVAGTACGGGDAVGDAASVNPTAGDWTQFRGPGGSGIAESNSLPTTWSADENVLWKTDLPGAGASSPILIGDRIYLTCYTGYSENRGDIAKLTRHLICLNRTDGKIRWTKEVAAKQPEEEKNREGHGYATSTPVADADRVYVFFGKSGVLAFDHDGQQLWQTDVGDGTNGWGSAASPILYKNTVIVNASVESESMVALDRESGKEIWRARGIKEAWNTPILAQTANGKTELVVAIFRKLLGFDPDTGKELWNADTKIDWYMAPSLIAHDGVVYSVGGRTGGSLAVRLGGRGNVDETHRVWLGKKGSNVTSPVYHEGHVYWMHENLGIAYCAEAVTGKIVYEERVRGAGQVYASPVLADKKIYYFNRQGTAFVLPAKPEYELLATNEVEPRATFNSSPAVADDRLFVRTDKAIYAIGNR
ncbi:MAG: PQQ-binding-like beta-propeller repeat protein [Pirellulales bacterium]